jgi:hypothetical protein
MRRTLIKPSKSGRGNVRTWLSTAAAAGAVATMAVAPASATAPPVGPIPKGPLSQVSTSKGELVAVALARKPNGLVWRLARPVDKRGLRQVSEATAGRILVVVFRATGRGTARVVFALTRGEAAHAFASVTHTIRVG